MPFSYYVRSSIYEAFAYSTFESCEPGTYSAVCIQEETPGAGVPGVKIIDAFSNVSPIASSEDTTIRDTMILIAIGCAWKVVYAIGVIHKTRQVAVIEEPNISAANREQNERDLCKNRTAELSADGHFSRSSKGRNGHIPYAMPDDLSEELSV